MTCSDLMNRQVEWVAGSSTVLEAARLMRDRSVGLVLVSDPVPGESIGVVTDRDLAVRACAEALDCAQTTVGRVATLGIVSCRDDDALQDAEERMGDAQKSRIVVMSSTGQVVGVLSLTDIMRGDGARRAVRTANAVLAREVTAHAPVESIHLTASTPEDEEAAASRDHMVIGGARTGSMKEFPS